MPLPLIVLGLGLAGLVGGKIAQASSKRTEEETSSILGDANRYLAQRQAEFARKRRAFYERIVTYNQIVLAVIGQRMPAASSVSAELPREFLEFWETLSESVEFYRTDFTALFSGDERRLVDSLRTVAVVNRLAPQYGGAAFAAAGAGYAAEGLNHVTEARRAKEKAMSDAAAARLAADRKLAALDATAANLDLGWNNLVTPLLHLATGPDRDDAMAGALMQMVEELKATAEDTLRVIANE
jgi:hypothetical protein